MEGQFLAFGPMSNFNLYTYNLNKSNQLDSIQSASREIGMTSRCKERVGLKFYRFY